jgi:hypothetical protein
MVDGVAVASADRRHRGGATRGDDHEGAARRR